MHTQASEFLDLFAGRSDMYGVMTLSGVIAPNGKVEKSKPLYIEELVTAELWSNHLNGKGPPDVGIGIIPIRPISNDVKWAAIDIDPPEYKTDPSVWVDVLQKISKRKFPLCAWLSKSGGLHLTIHFKNWTNASVARNIVQYYASQLGVGGSEIFPKQVKLGESGHGTWLNMPMFGDKRQMITEQGLLGAIDAVIQMKHKRINASECGISSSNVNAGKEPYPEGPPCINSLLIEHEGVIPNGMRNTMFMNVAVMMHKVYGDALVEPLKTFNQNNLAKAPGELQALSDAEVDKAIRGARDIGYNYQCSAVPLCNHCNRSLCLTRKHGIGGYMEGMIVPGTVTRMGGEPYQWKFTVTCAEEELTCSTNVLLNVARYREFVFERTGVMVTPEVKQAQWLGMVQSATENHAFEEPSFETTIAGRLWAIFTDWLDKRSTANEKADILRGLVWKEKGHYWFQWKHFERELERVKFRDLSMTQIGRILREKFACERRSLRVSKGLAIHTYCLPIPGDTPGIEYTVPHDIAPPEEI